MKISHLGYMESKEVAELLTQIIDYTFKTPSVSAVREKIKIIYEDLKPDSDKNVIQLAEGADNALLWTPVDALVGAMEDISKGRRAFKNCKKLLILALDDTQNNKDISFVQAGMYTSDCVFLCEAAKTIFLKQLGY